MLFWWLISNTVEDSHEVKEVLYLETTKKTFEDVVYQVLGRNDWNHTEKANKTSRHASVFRSDGLHIELEKWINEDPNINLIYIYIYT